jgi:hypothetical protein
VKLKIPIQSKMKLKIILDINDEVMKNIQLDKLEPRNNVLGYEVVMNFVGPYYKTTLLQFADKCSGYATCSSLKNGKKKTHQKHYNNNLIFMLSMVIILNLIIYL